MIIHTTKFPIFLMIHGPHLFRVFFPNRKPRVEKTKILFQLYKWIYQIRCQNILLWTYCLLLTLKISILICVSSLGLIENSSGSFPRVWAYCVLRALNLLQVSFGIVWFSPEQNFYIMILTPLLYFALQAQYDWTTELKQWGVYFETLPRKAHKHILKWTSDII